MDTLSSSVKASIERIAQADKDLCQSLFQTKNGQKNVGQYTRTFIFDRNHRILHFSPIAAKWAGLSPAQTIGKNRLELGFTNYTDSFERALTNVFATGEVEINEGVQTRYTGNSSVQYYQSVFTPLLGNNGTVEAVVSVVSDITKQRRAETQAANQVKFLEQLIENAPLGILVIDNHEIVQYHNRAYRESRSAGFQETKSWVGKPMCELAEAIGYQHDYRQSYVMRALKGKCQFNERTSGFGREWLAHFFPVYDVDEQIVAGVAIFHDISELVSLQKNLHRLDRLNLVGQMAAGVAHEIRNPMTVIKGYLQVFAKNLPENMLDRVELILKELERVEAIITEFLSLARFKASEKESISLSSVVREIIPLISTDAMKKGVDFETELNPDIPLLPLDVKEIRQLVLNLSRNGTEAIQGHGKVRIETAFDSDIASLSISDTGKGIPKEVLPKIFDPFFSTKDSGTGLGLAICASIVERHHGTIEVTSEEGRGTKFTIKFPIEVVK